MENQMIHESKKPAMIPVAQPSRHQPRAYWDKLELDRLTAMSSVATARQAAAQKREVAL
jgi:hypothetical protein